MQEQIMPLQYIPAQKGWRYGKTGKVYKGPQGRAKARTQGTAIEISKLRKEGRIEEHDGKITVHATKRARSHIREI